MSPIIEVRNLSKRYRLGAIGATSFREEFHRYLDRWRGIPHPDEKEFWAVRDVSFDVAEGEIVGVIGRNGAGKSTLLKILSRITEPTSGTAILRGRVASLLEVGTGFHPELTGRENVYLNGAILGMTRAEVARKFDEIVAFAEVEQFIDTPVKRYSSGMYVRLAFAVAAHLEPEILIVDEVLAVGDAAFQKKCLGKMEDVSARQGRTVLFVSHNMVAVRALCRQAIFLEHGRLSQAGDVGTVLGSYLQLTQADQRVHEWRDAGRAPGSEFLRVRRIEISPEPSGTDGLITMKTGVTIATDYHVMSASRPVHLTYHLLNDQGAVVLTAGLKSQTFDPGHYRAGVTIPANLLNSGSYSLKLHVVEDGNRVVVIEDNIASFTVIDTTERTHGWHGREPGVVQPKLPWTLDRLADA